MTLHVYFVPRSKESYHRPQGRRVRGVTRAVVSYVSLSDDRAETHYVHVDGSARIVLQYRDSRGWYDETITHFAPGSWDFLHYPGRWEKFPGEVIPSYTTDRWVQDIRAIVRANGAEQLPCGHCF